MHRTWAIAVTALLLSGAMVGCGSSSEPEESAATATATSGPDEGGDDLQAQIREAAEQAASQLAQVPEPEDPAASSDSLLSSSGQQATSQTMEQFLTSVIQNVDAFWTRNLTAAGLTENQVSYSWPAPGQGVQTKCVDAEGQPEVTSDRSAAYCPADDTIYFSQQFAVDLWEGTADNVLPGARVGYGKSVGDFAVAYVVAHEYAHSIQHQLGLYEQIYKAYPDAVVQDRPFELQADCMAGVWSNAVYHQGLLEPGDVEEALDAALAVGDLGFTERGHHGKPEERHAAWKVGYDTGNTGECNRYLSPENITVAQPEQPEGGGVVIIGGS